MMVLKCTVANCSYESGKDERIKVHSFPVESPTIVQKWISNMKLPKSLQLESVKETGGICSQHFLRKCFSSQDKAPLKLRENAVPTLLQSDDERKAWKKVAPDAEALMEVQNEEEQVKVKEEPVEPPKGRAKAAKTKSHSDHSYQVDSTSPARSTRSTRSRTPKVILDPSPQASRASKRPSSSLTAKNTSSPKTTVQSKTSSPSKSSSGLKTRSASKNAASSKTSPTKDVAEEKEKEDEGKPSSSSPPQLDENSQSQTQLKQQEANALKKEIFELTKRVNFQKAQIHRLESRLLHRENKVEDLEFAIEKLKAIIMCCECGLKPDNLDDFAKTLKRKRTVGKEGEEGTSDGGASKESATPKKAKPVPNKPTQVICRNDLVVSLTWSELFSRVNSLAEDFEDQ